MAKDRWWLWFCRPLRDMEPASTERDDGCRRNPIELAACCPCFACCIPALPPLGASFSGTYVPDGGRRGPPGDEGAPGDAPEGPPEGGSAGFHSSLARTCAEFSPTVLRLELKERSELRLRLAMLRLLLLRLERERDRPVWLLSTGTLA